MHRCDWAKKPLDIEYHDKDWGVPVHDDRYLFEMLILEGAQAGLSWSTILAKREGYKEAFDNFDAEKIAEYDAAKIEELRQDSRIVRNKLKINSAVVNARCFLEVQKEFGSFDKYIWAFVDGKSINNAWETQADIPGNTEISDAMSKDLKKRGFKFVGTTICYAFMQSVGMVNDHLTSCFRYEEVKALNQ